MARKLTVGLAMLVVVAFLAFSAVPAEALPDSLLAQGDAPPERATEQTNPYAGPDGASPMDEVPVAPMVGATAAVLVVLSVIAVRREWLL